ncbi:MAG: ABC transporter substrate-binding protein, partial [Spirochaetia bacterium]|nr:ABC transporter substrate-binding protein [Spirochaetia bacterium]
MKKAVGCMLLVLGIAALIVACGPAAPKTVKFGVFEPLTGANAGGGALEVEGIKLANEMYPTVKVGDKEYKIELVIADNKSDKVEAANAAMMLAQKAKVNAVIGS